ncbi:unnamed protein product [marine sediment metagenome]|uniref:Uncharacterized protein n=1 Tax=marine sediment metagenome TaxID=412755 RepID=X0TMX8_9ZZZZ
MSGHLNTDEIREKLEESYDAVQAKAEEAEGIVESSCWRMAGLHIEIAINTVSRIKRGCEVFDEDDLYYE